MDLVTKDPDLPRPQTDQDPVRILWLTPLIEPLEIADVGAGNGHVASTVDDDPISLSRVQVKPVENDVLEPFLPTDQDGGVPVRHRNDLQANEPPVAEAQADSSLEDDVCSPDDLDRSLRAARHTAFLALDLEGPHILARE